MYKEKNNINIKRKHTKLMLDNDIDCFKFFLF
jgi:hypothetical protein